MANGDEESQGKASMINNKTANQDADADAGGDKVQPDSSKGHTPNCDAGGDKERQGSKKDRVIDKTISSMASLSQLLPSNTVFAFQALAPSFTNTGKCSTANKMLTIALIFCSAVTCFFFSFSDTIKDKPTGKFYHGIATFRGFYIFNKPHPSEKVPPPNLNERELKLNGIDFIHAIVSFGVFLAFALSDANVVMCFFSRRTENLNALVLNLPLGLSALASIIFFIFPTSRQGIGYGDCSTKKKIGGN